jgi:hypothetical protein
MSRSRRWDGKTRLKPHYCQCDPEAHCQVSASILASLSRRTRLSMRAWAISGSSPRSVLAERSECGDSCQWCKTTASIDTADHSSLLFDRGTACGVATETGWAVRFTLAAVIASLILCVVGWPDARIGVAVNVGLALLLAIGHRLNLAELTP